MQRLADGGRYRKGAARTLAIVVAILTGLAALVVIGPPLVLRGPVFVRLVRRALPPLAGEVHLGGGHIGWGAVVALALGRPAGLHLDNIMVRDPEGTEVLGAATVDVAVELHRNPWGVVLHELRPRQARWRFGTMHTHRGIGFLAAFRPARRPGPAVGRTEPRRPAAPAKRSAGVSFAIASADLDGLDVVFDFAGWGLELDDLIGQGSLGLDAEGAAVSFDVRNVDARRGGSLRVLPARRGLKIPFDRVQIERVGTPQDAPGDLLLLVSAARTGASTLSGRALFGGVMDPRAASARLEIDAGWTQAGEVLTRLGRAQGLTGLQVSGAAARLEASVRGSTEALEAGHFSADGLDVSYRGFRADDLGIELLAQGPPYAVTLERLSLRAPAGGALEATGSLAGDGQARVRLRLDGLATAGMLPPYLRPLLGGRADGWLAARGDLVARRFALAGLDLALARTQRGPLPRRVRIVAGRTGQVLPTLSEESLTASVRGARFAHGALQVDGLEATAFGGRLAANAELAVETERGARLDPPRLDLGVRVRDVDLARVVPTAGLDGRLSFWLLARGPLDDIATRIDFNPGSVVRVVDQPYGLPARAELRVRGGNDLTLSPLRLSAPGGGALAVSGRLALDRAMDLEVTAERNRLDRIPFLSRALPSLGGEVSARLRLRGPPLAPGLEGSVALTGVALAGVPLGRGAVTLSNAGNGLSTFRGELFERLRFSGRLRTGAEGPSLEAGIDAEQLTLDPFLPPLPLIRGARLGVSGHFDLRAQAGKPLDLAAELRSIVFGYGCGRAGAPRPAGCVQFENVGPVKLRARGGTQWLTLERTRLRAPGSDFTVGGRLEGGAMSAALDGRLDLALLAPLLRRWPVVATGALEAALRAHGPLTSPRLEGQLRIGSPLEVRGRSRVFSARLTKGELNFDGDRVRSPGLTLEAPGALLVLSGDAPMTPTADPHTALSLALEGEVDASLLARAIPQAVISARGPVRVKTRLSGTLGDPRFSGEADVGALDLRLRWHDTHVAVRGGRVSAQQQQIRIDELVADARPGGHLVLGPRGQPAEVEVLSLYPFDIGRVRLPAIGRDLNLDLGWLRLQQGAFDLRLVGDATHGPLTLAGDVEIGVGRFQPRKQPRGGGGGAGRVARKLPAEVRSAVVPLALDLHVKSDGRKFVIDPGWLPDLHYDLDVRVGGNTARPAVDWAADPKGLYSAFALFLYRLFS